jgi:hypothetical protein
MDSQMMPVPKAKKQTKDIQIEDEDKPLAGYKSEGGFIVEDASEEEEFDAALENMIDDIEEASAESGDSDESDDEEDDAVADALEKEVEKEEEDEAMEKEIEKELVEAVQENEDDEEEDDEEDDEELNSEDELAIIGEDN